MYEGKLGSEPEVDVQDDLGDDWDEASMRSSAAEATEAHVAEVQPGPLDAAEIRRRIDKARRNGRRSRGGRR